MKNNILQDAAQKLLEQLNIEEGNYDSALTFITDQYDVAVLFKNQMIEFGYEEEEAYRVAAVKLSNSVVNKGTRVVKMGKLVPLRILNEAIEEGWESLTSRQQNDVLWELGINTRQKCWFTDAACFNYCEKRECGVFLFGEERTDREWLTKKIGDNSVASIEARYHKDKETLNVLRGYG